jgi:hypothetical protein
VICSRVDPAISVDIGGGYIESRNIESWLSDGLVHPPSLDVVEVASYVESEKPVCPGVWAK